MSGGSVSGRAVGDLAGLRPRELDQVADRARREFRVGYEDVWGGGQQRDRREIADRIVGQVVIQADVGRVVWPREQQRVAIGLAFRDERRADVRCRARTVFDDDLFTPFLAHLLRDEPPDNVCAAACRERHDHANGLCGIAVCRESRAGQGNEHCGGVPQDRTVAHRGTLIW